MNEDADTHSQKLLTAMLLAMSLHSIFSISHKPMQWCSLVPRGKVRIWNSDGHWDGVSMVISCVLIPRDTILCINSLQAYVPTWEAASTPFERI